MKKSFVAARFVWNRKKRVNKKGLAVVELEVRYERDRKWISTGVMIKDGEWDESRCEVKGNGDDVVAKNERLMNIMRRVRRMESDLDREDVEFKWSMLDRVLESSANCIEEISDNDSLYRRVNKGRMSFTEWVEERIENRGDIRESTKRQHRVMIESVKQYGRLERFCDLRYENIQGYDDFLHKKQISGGSLVQTTIHGYHKRLKSYIKDAIAARLLKEDPYVGIEVKRGKPSGIKYLEEDEFVRLRDLVIDDDTLDMQRDVFLFQCYTGLAYADVKEFCKQKVVERDGHYYVRDNRVKSNEEYWIMLMAPAVEILNKHDWNLHVISNQQSNRMLKVIGMAAKIQKKLSTHMGRHTFAVRAINHGVQLEMLAKMMGHTDVKTTQVYAKIVNKSLNDEWLKMEKVL